MVTVRRVNGQIRTTSSSRLSQLRQAQIDRQRAVRASQAQARKPTPTVTQVKSQLDLARENRDSIQKKFDAGVARLRTLPRNSLEFNTLDRTLKAMKQDVRASRDIVSTLKGAPTRTQKKRILAIKKEAKRMKVKIFAEFPETEFVTKGKVIKKKKRELKVRREKITPISSDLQKKLKVLLPISIRQQLQQQQTTTTQIKDFIRTQELQQRASKITGIRFDIRGEQNIKRGLRGEHIQPTMFGLIVRKKDGTARPLTSEEAKEFLPQASITLNPVNILTGFFGLSKDIGFALSTPNKKAKIAAGVAALLSDPDAAINSAVDSVVTNPFGFIGELAGFNAIQKVVLAPFRNIKSFKIKDRNKLNTDISKLKKQGTKVTDRTIDGSKLRNLEIQKKIVEADLSDLNKVINKFNKPIKSKAGLNQAVSSAKKSGSNIRNRNKKRIKLKQQLKDFDLKPVKPKPITIIKTLPKDAAQINKLLLTARGVSGNAFKKLKIRIKKEFNLNVVQRGAGKDLNFKLLEPKEQRRKGVKTKRELGKQFIVVDGKIIKAKPITIKELPAKEKLTKSDLKDLEFKAGQNLDKVQKDFVRIAKKQEFFKSKKAQGRMMLTFRRHVKSNVDQVKNIKQRQKQVGVTVRKFNARLQKPVRSSKQLTNLKSLQKKLNLSKQKIKQDAIQVNKNLIKLRILFNLIKALGIGLKSGVKQINAQASALDSVVQNINALKVDTPKPTPPSIPRPGKPRGKPTKRPPVKLVRKPVKKPPSKPARKPPGKLRVKPPKKPPTRLRVKLKFGVVLPKGQRLAFGIRFRERKNLSKPFNKKTNPVIVKSRDLKLPLNSALNKVLRGVDKSTRRSGELFITGITTRKDIGSPKQILKKFRLKRTPKTLRFVEKSQFAIDSRAEKRGLRKARRQAKKKSKTIKRKKTKR